MSQPDESVRVPLTRPIQAHGETVSALELREPELGDLEGVGVILQQAAGGAGGSLKFVLGDFIPVIAAMARIPPSSARRIKARDIGTDIEAVFDFLPDTLRTSSS